jgi:hypothetical protein
MPVHRRTPGVGEIWYRSVVNDIEELRDVIRRIHGVESKHLESISVKEEFHGHIQPGAGGRAA